MGAALNAAKPKRETALVDGVFAGMIVGKSEVGRSLLMVFSDGLDTASFLNADGYWSGTNDRMWWSIQ